MGYHIPGDLGRKGVAPQGVADGARRGFEMGCQQRVRAEGARGDLVGELPYGSLEGGAPR